MMSTITTIFSGILVFGGPLILAPIVFWLGYGFGSILIAAAVCWWLLERTIESILSLKEYLNA